LIDVRPMPPRERHPKIFSTWGALPEGGSMILVNDHDPLPLYYQFAAEHAGGFRWEYEESGPEIWRVRISRGVYADPGFTPVPGARGSCRPASVPISFVKERVLDVRPLLERGESPCQAIESAIGSLVKGQSLVVLAPFEPIPLYAKLGRCGYAHDTTRPSEGLWRVEFKPTGETDTEQFEPCGCQHD
jgi:uncharacterized protein (DUF2249 family)